MVCIKGACEFVTPQGIPTYELVLKCLEIHVQSAHLGPVTQRTESSSKVKKLKRPLITSSMRENKWTFFLHKLERYSRIVKFTVKQKLDELWACMDDSIERLVFN